MASLDEVLTELNELSLEIASSKGMRRRELEQRRKELHTQAEVWDTSLRREEWLKELDRLKQRLGEIDANLITTSAKRGGGIRGMLWGEWNWHEDAEKLNDRIKDDSGRAAIQAKVTELERKMGLIE